jgi:hypothetical protein
MELAIRKVLATKKKKEKNNGRVSKSDNLY